MHAPKREIHERHIGRHLDGGASVPALRQLLGTKFPAESESSLARLAGAETWKLEGIDQGAVDRANLAQLAWPEKIRWLHQYNWHRPHASLGYQPPISRLPLPLNNVMGLHS